MSVKYTQRQVTSTEIQVAEVVTIDGKPTLQPLETIVEIGNLTDKKAKAKAQEKHEGKEIVLVEATPNTFTYRMPTLEFIQLAEKVEENEGEEVPEELEQIAENAENDVSGLEAQQTQVEA